MKGISWKQKGADFILSVSMVACSVVFLLMFFLSLTVLQAQQALRVLAFVVPKDIGQSGFVGAIPFDDFKTDKAWRELLEEMMVRYYVEMRYTILPDYVEMLRRWGPNGSVKKLSSPQLYASFAAKEANPERLKENNVIQTVDIKTVRKLQAGSYMVSFDVYRKGIDGMRKIGPITISLAYRYSGDGFFSPSFSNPLGIYFVAVDRSVN
ncbi:MAG: hypothetical protein J6Y85_00650 [Alphaproteobacteria bacterium]|nr:hypothetical protein [Alphaproteobacteria bacterium]